MVVQKQNKVNVKSSTKNRCLNLSGDSVVNTSVTSTASTICKTTDNDIYGLQGKYLLYVSLTKRGARGPNQVSRKFPNHELKY